MFSQRLRTGATLALTVALLSACTSSDAVSFNNSIVDKQQEISTKMNALADSITKGTPDQLQKDLADLNTLIDTKITEVKALPTMDKGEEFKDAAVKSFTFYKTSANDMVKIIGGTDDPMKMMTDLTAMVAKMQADSDSYDKAIKAAQAAFADANGMKIQS